MPQRDVFSKASRRQRRQFYLSSIDSRLRSSFPPAFPLTRNRKLMLADNRKPGIAPSQWNHREHAGPTANDPRKRDSFLRRPRLHPGVLQHCADAQCSRETFQNRTRLDHDSGVLWKRRKLAQALHCTDGHLDSIINVFVGVVLAKAEPNRPAGQFVISPERAYHGRRLYGSWWASWASRNGDTLHVEMN